MLPDVEAIEPPKRRQVSPVQKSGKKRTAKLSTNKEAATRLHSLIVRSIGRCEAEGMFGVECMGALQCAHVIPRRFAATRTDLANGRSLCLRHHHHVDSFPGDMVELVGRDTYDALRIKAERGVREFADLTPMMWWRQERERLTEIARAKGII